MSIIRTVADLRRRPFRAIGVVLLLLFLVLVVFAASPELHQTIHSDANTAGHHCAISALSQGHFEPPACNPPLCTAPVLSSCSTPFVPSVFGGAIELLPPGRAPPIVFS